MADENEAANCAKPPVAFKLPDALLVKVREELLCVVCFEICTRPATLPCGHSGCRRCLNHAFALGHVTEPKKCPTCRAPLPIGMPSLKINATLKNLAELLLPEECKERSPSPTDAPRPPELVQRVMLHTGGRAVSMHTIAPLSQQAQRSTVAGLNALLQVVEERWPEQNGVVEDANAAAAAAGAAQPGGGGPPSRQQAQNAGPALVQPRWQSARAFSAAPRTEARARVEPSTQHTPTSARQPAAPPPFAQRTPTGATRWGTQSFRERLMADPTAARHAETGAAPSGGAGASPHSPLSLMRANLARMASTLSARSEAAAIAAPEQAPAEPQDEQVPAPSQQQAPAAAPAAPRLSTQTVPPGAVAPEWNAAWGSRSFRERLMADPTARRRPQLRATSNCFAASPSPSMHSANRARTTSPQPAPVAASATAEAAPAEPQEVPAPAPSQQQAPPAPAPAPPQLSTHMRTAVAPVWNETSWDASTCEDPAVPLEQRCGQALACSLSTAPGQALLAVQFLGAALGEARAGSQAHLTAVTGVASQLFTSISHQLARHIQLAEAVQQGGSGEVAVPETSMRSIFEFIGAAGGAMLSALELPDSAELAMQLKQAAIHECFASSLVVLSSVVLSSERWPEVRPAQRTLSALQEALLRRANPAHVLDALLCLLRAPFTISELYQIVPGMHDSARLLFMRLLSKLLVMASSLLRRHQEVDLGPVLLSLHHVVSTPPHPDGATAELQQAAVKRFIAGVCREMQVEAILPHLDRLPCTSAIPHLLAWSYSEQEGAVPAALRSYIDHAVEESAVGAEGAPAEEHGSEEALAATQATADSAPASSGSEFAGMVFAAEAPNGSAGAAAGRNTMRGRRNSRGRAGVAASQAGEGSRGGAAAEAPAQTQVAALFTSGRRSIPHDRNGMPIWM